MEYRRIVCVLDFRYIGFGCTYRQHDASIMTSRGGFDEMAFFIFLLCANIEIIRESFVSRERENADSSQILRFCIQRAWCSSIIHLSSVACATQDSLENCVKKTQKKQNPICRCLSSWRQYVSFYRPYNLKKLSLGNWRRARKRFLRDLQCVFLNPSTRLKLPKK